MKTETEIRRRLAELAKRQPARPGGRVNAVETQYETLQWVLAEPEGGRDLARSGVATLSRERRLEEDVRNLREEVELLRECRFFGRDYSHKGCRHAEAPAGAVVGPGIHWSLTLEDAVSDHGRHGGFLLREGGRYVVVEEFEESNPRAPALRLRTAAQYEAMTEASGWSEVPEGRS